MITVLEIDRITKSYRAPGRPPVRVLDDVGLRVDPGEAVGLVGESGSGKTTLIKCALRLERPSSGAIRFDGQDIGRLRGRALRDFRRSVQLVFQDPHASLNPRMTVEQLVGEGLLVHGLAASASERTERVAELLGMVGLEPSVVDRYPASFSGGQRQRIAIARALAVRPRLLVCDEPVAALDVSVQAQVINLLADMRQRLGLAVLFVAHDLAVVRHLCGRIAVLCEGRIVEEGPRDRVFDAPEHSYTKALLDAVPVPDPSGAA